jgi:hypothetical protein
MMLPSESASAFHRFLADRGIDPNSASSRLLIDAALDFYEQVPASGLADASQADMLLFQFGTYDWGDGDYFEVDITRQFIISGEEGDDAISQLNCTLFYRPTDAFQSMGKGNRWCESREGVADFKAFIVASDAYLRTAAASPIKRKILWSPI